MKKNQYILVVLIVLIMSINVYSDENNTFDVYINIIKISNNEESNNSMKDTIFAYKDMLERYPNKYWTIAAQGFMLLSFGINIDRSFEEYIIPDSEVNILILSTLYFYQWPNEFKKYVEKIENSDSIYGTYAKIILYTYYAGLAPNRPIDYEKSISYIKSIIDNKNNSKEILIDAYETLGCCNLSMTKNPSESIKIFNNILSQTSNDVELESLYKSKFRENIYIELIQAHSENGEREISKKYFDILKKEFPEYKNFDILEKLYIDTKSHPELEIK